MQYSYDWTRVDVQELVSEMSKEISIDMGNYTEAQKYLTPFQHQIVVCLFEYQIDTETVFKAIEQGVCSKGHTEYIWGCLVILEALQSLRIIMDRLKGKQFRLWEYADVSQFLVELIREIEIERNAYRQALTRLMPFQSQIIRCLIEYQIDPYELIDSIKQGVKITEREPCNGWALFVVLQVLSLLKGLMEL